MILQDNETDVSISGAFDQLFEKYFPAYIDWRVLKSLAFYLSELQPYVEGGLFRIPHKVYYEYDGADPMDHEDNIKTMSFIVMEWWDILSFMEDNKKLYFIVLAYLLNLLDPRYALDIRDTETNRITDRIIVMSEVM